MRGSIARIARLCLMILTRKMRKLLKRRKGNKIPLHKMLLPPLIHLKKVHLNLGR